MIFFDSMKLEDLRKLSSEMREGDTLALFSIPAGAFNLQWISDNGRGYCGVAYELPTPEFVTVSGRADSAQL